MNDLNIPSVFQSESALVGGVPNGLRALREQAGLHLAALAVTLKVSPQKLEALEAGRYDELPNMTFVRALATSVCRVLKVDPAPVLASLPQAQDVHIRASSEGLNTPFPLRGGSAVPSQRLAVLSRMAPRPVWLALVVLLLAGLLWVVLPQQVHLGDIAAVSTSPDTASEPESAPVAVAVVPEVEPTVPVTVVPPEVQTVPVAASAVVPPVTESVPAAPSSNSASPEAEPLAAGGDPLRLHTRQSTWVQVTGASGRLLLQRTLQAGEDVTFTTDLPLAVVVGRAEAAEVLVRGNPFDLTPYVRNRVARFEVR